MLLNIRYGHDHCTLLRFHVYYDDFKGYSHVALNGEINTVSSWDANKGCLNGVAEKTKSRCRY